jgi:hypothetical protein
MIECIANPFLFDYLYVASRLPVDEREQITELTGHQFDIDGAATGAFMVNGPKWAIKKDGIPLSIFGAHQERPGVWRDFMMNTPETFAPENYASVTRHCKRAMDTAFKQGVAHRIECIVPLSRSHVFRWYAALGYKFETVMPGYLVSGQPAALFARLKPGIAHGNGIKQLSQ